MSDDIDRDDWPVHQPEAFDAPIPGRHWYAGCEPGGDLDPETMRYEGTGPRVDPETGICEGCGEIACRECGRENCPDHQRRIIGDLCWKCGNVIGRDCNCEEERNVDVSNGELSVPWVRPPSDEDEFGRGLGEVDAVAEREASDVAELMFPEPEDDAEDEEQESQCPKQLRELAANLREAADAMEAMADTEHPLPVELSLSTGISFYTYEAESFKGLSRALGGLRKKGGFDDAFWIERNFGKGSERVNLTIHAPGREAVCTPKVVGKREVEEQIYVKTGRMVEEDIIEWDCGSILSDDPIEEQHIDAQAEGV